MAKMMLKAMIVAGLATAGLAAQPAFAQRGVNATADASPGSAQRRAILDALRPVVQRRLGPNVEFVILRIGVRDGWALVIADPQRRGGGLINPRAHFSRAELEGMDSSLQVNAFLRFRGGRWQVVDHAIGPTDVWYCGLQGAPRALTGC